MTDKRIDAHTNTTTVADVDEFIVDSGSNGTRNITYSNLKSQILGSTSIATIGNSVTEAIYNTYTDIGDLTQTGVTGATVAAQISQLNAEIAVQSVNNIDSLKTSNVSACYGTLYKINGLVFLNFTALYTSEMSASNTALSLTSGFKPSSAVYGNGIILKSNGAAYTALVKINTNGNVFGDTSTTGTVLSGTIIYKV